MGFEHWKDENDLWLLIAIAKNFSQKIPEQHEKVSRGGFWYPFKVHFLII